MVAAKQTLSVNLHCARCAPTAPIISGAHEKTRSNPISKGQMRARICSFPYYKINFKKHLTKEYI
jgi:hypothetical protein